MKTHRAIAKPITEDDVYEFACSLELGTVRNAREALAAKLRKCVSAQGTQAQAESNERPTGESDHERIVMFHTRI